MVPRKWLLIAFNHGTMKWVIIGEVFNPNADGKILGSMKAYNLY